MGQQGIEVNTDEIESQEVLLPPKKGGRPKGSKNKKQKLGNQGKRTNSNNVPDPKVLTKFLEINKDFYDGKYLDLTDEQKTQKVKLFTKKVLDDFWIGGRSLVSKKLKSYTTGNKETNIGLERLFGQILGYAIWIFDLKSKLEILPNTYLYPDPENPQAKDDDPQRLDHHIVDKSNNMIVWLQEDRAWLDKPFHTLKSGVVQLLLSIPGIKNRISEKTPIVSITLACDLTNKTKNTNSKYFTGGDRLKIFNLSEKKRTKNWFDETEVKEKVVNEYCDLLSSTMIEFSKTKK